MKKSQGVGFILTFLLGPLGLLYSNVVAAIAVLLGAFLFGAVLGGVIAGFVAWGFSIILSFVLVDSHNAKVEVEEQRRIEIEERRHKEILAVLGGKGPENPEGGAHQSQAPDGGNRL